MDRERLAPDERRVIDVIQRANHIAATTELDTLLDKTLDLFVEVACAEAGTLYLYDAERDELVFRVVKGDPSSQRLIGTRFSADRGIAGAALRANRPIFADKVANDPRWERRLGELASLRLRTAYCLPLAVAERPVGVVQVFNLPSSAVDDAEELALLDLLAHCMVSEIEKARLLDAARQRERRMSALVEIISRLTTTLDRQELLTLIMDHARELLDVEATSVWELNEEQNELVPHVATGEHGEQLRTVRVPFGEGIIGHVVKTGERVLVDDVRSDQRHYQDVDRHSGFVTRSIMCVPLRAPTIQLGRERGELKSRIIGGAQALNKRHGGGFSADDLAMFDAFASQAATVLQLARLYDETYQLFEGVLKVITGFIDAKDPYTQGHSQRVSEFAVAIAEELGLSREEVYHVKIGGILHDVGKIGVPDAILKKKDRLSDAEYAEMKRHAAEGHRIMSQDELRWLLRHELPALLEHHERLDGRGYPRNLVGDQISLIGRIMAVADVFDAITSDRQYRAGISVEQALLILQAGAGTEFDLRCVDALCRAREAGRVRTQREQGI